MHGHAQLLSSRNSQMKARTQSADCIRDLVLVSQSKPKRQCTVFYVFVFKLELATLAF